MAAEESILNPSGNRTFADIRTSAEKLLSSYSRSYIHLKEREEAALSEEVRERLAELALKDLLEMDRILADFYNQQDIALARATPDLNNSASIN